jgi:hypothetical protein
MGVSWRCSKSPHTSLYNRTNNIVDPNANMTQLKLFLDPLLGELLE